MEGFALHTLSLLSMCHAQSVQKRSKSMEIMIAIAMFAAIVAAWFVLPTSSR